MHNPTPTVRQPRLSEDWQATLIGLLIVALIGSGIFGPGGQNVSVKAAAGASGVTSLRPLSGWQVSATLAGDKLVPESPATTAVAGESVILVCREGALMRGDGSLVPADTPRPPEDRAQLVLVNQCDGEVVVTYRTSALIPWPVFNLFSR